MSGATKSARARRAVGPWFRSQSEPVDSASFAFFRVAFGLVVAWEIYRFFDHELLRERYLDAGYNFHYWPFTFVEPFPPGWLEASFVFTAVCGVAMALGVFYRAASICTALGLTYIFLLEKASYLNHFYLVVLIAWLFALLPFAARFSWPARNGTMDLTIPRFALTAMQIQIAIPYFYGGLAKLNADWVRASPLRDTLSRSTDFPLVGQFFVEVPVVYFMAYGAMIFDLVVAPLLLFRRTRPFAFLAAIGFHLANSRLFGIGIFPWTMLLATPILLEASWPLRLVEQLRSSVLNRIVILASGAATCAVAALLPTTISPWKAGIGFVAGCVGAYLFVDLLSGSGSADAEAPESKRVSSRRGFPQTKQTWVFRVAVLWCCFQLLFPLRHFAIGSNVHWSEEGHNFSWHMKLRSKDAVTEWTVSADGYEPLAFDPRHYLTNRQYDKMTVRPDMMQQFAVYIEEAGLVYPSAADHQVYVKSLVQLNDRTWGPLVDPNRDLTSVRRPVFGGADWILDIPPIARKAPVGTVDGSPVPEDANP